MAIIDELEDRRNREKNVIIFNLEEAEGENLSDRQSHESNKVTELISSIDDTVDLNNIKYVRLGKYSLDKMRPLKVILSSKDDALKILKSRRKAGEPLKINSDLTPMQRNHLSALRLQLEELNNNGANKAIRYVKGKPQIVDSKN